MWLIKSLKIIASYKGKLTKYSTNQKPISRKKPIIKLTSLLNSVFKFIIVFRKTFFLVSKLKEIKYLHWLKSTINKMLTFQYSKTKYGLSTVGIPNSITYKKYGLKNYPWKGVRFRGIFKVRRLLTLKSLYYPQCPLFLNFNKKQFYNRPGLVSTNYTKTVHNKFFWLYHMKFTGGDWSVVGPHYSFSKWINYLWFDDDSFEALQNYISSSKKKNKWYKSRCFKRKKNYTHFVSKLRHYSEIIKKLKFTNLETLKTNIVRNYKPKLAKLKSYWVLKLWRSKLRKVFLKFKLFKYAFQWPNYWRVFNERRKKTSIILDNSFNYFEKKKRKKRDYFLIQRVFKSVKPSIKLLTYAKKQKHIYLRKFIIKLLKLKKRVIRWCEWNELLNEVDPLWSSSRFKIGKRMARERRLEKRLLKFPKLNIVTLNIKTKIKHKYNNACKSTKLASNTPAFNRLINYFLKSLPTGLTTTNTTNKLYIFFKKKSFFKKNFLKNFNKKLGYTSEKELELLRRKHNILYKKKKLFMFYLISNRLSHFQLKNIYGANKYRIYYETDRTNLINVSRSKKYYSRVKRFWRSNMYFRLYISRKKKLINGLKLKFNKYRSSKLKSKKLFRGLIDIKFRRLHEDQRGKLLKWKTKPKSKLEFKLIEVLNTSLDADLKPKFVSLVEKLTKPKFRKFYKKLIKYEVRNKFKNNFKHHKSYFLKYLSSFYGVKKKYFDLFTLLYYFNPKEDLKFKNLGSKIYRRRSLKSELRRPYLFLNSLGSKYHYAKVNNVYLVNSFNYSFCKNKLIKHGNNYNKRGKRFRRNKFFKVKLYKSFVAKKKILINRVKSTPLITKLSRKFNKPSTATSEYLNFIVVPTVGNSNSSKKKEWKRWGMLIGGDLRLFRLIFLKKRSITCRLLGLKIRRDSTFKSVVRLSLLARTESTVRKSKFRLREISFKTTKCLTYLSVSVGDKNTLAGLKFFKEGWTNPILNYLTSFDFKTAILRTKNYLSNVNLATKNINILVGASEFKNSSFGFFKKALKISNPNKLNLVIRVLKFLKTPNRDVSSINVINPSKILIKTSTLGAVKRSFIFGNIGFLVVNKFLLTKLTFKNFKLKYPFKKKLFSFVYPDRYKRSVLIRKKKIIISRFFKKINFKNKSYSRFRLKNVQQAFNTYYNNFFLFKFLKFEGNVLSKCFYPGTTTHYDVYKDAFSRKGYDYTFKFDEVAIPRIRFKPGYQRLWRRARSALQEIIRTKFRYQYRLTMHLAKFYKLINVMFLSYMETTLLKTIMFSRLLPDESALNLFLNHRSIFINGVLVTDLTIHIFVNDCIQLLVSIWYYIFYRWLRSWTIIRVKKLRRLIYRKNLPLKKKLMKLKKQRSNYTPNWIFNMSHDIFDIKSYLEVDYLTLSVCVVYDLSVLNFPTITNLYNSRHLIYRLYNWKYIN